MSVSELVRRSALIASGVGLTLLAVIVRAQSPVEQVADELLASHDGARVLILGELHGTEETPALAEALAVRLADSGRVALGLEITRKEQPRIDAFLGSDGGDAARAALLAGEFWQAEPAASDGRRSEAMLALIESIRAARARGQPIELVALDAEAFYQESGDRRQGLANAIVELAGRADVDAVVVLIGNYHARVSLPDRVISEGVVLAAPPQPMAARITAVPITTVNVSACAGEFWGCQSPGQCGPVAIQSQCPVLEFPVVEATDPNRFGYHMSVTLESLTVSPPQR